MEVFGGTAPRSSSTQKLQQRCNQWSLARCCDTDEYEIWRGAVSLDSWDLKYIYIYNMCIAYRKNMLLFWPSHVQYRLLGLWIHVRISMCAVERMDVFSARWQWTLIGAARGWLIVAKKKCQKSSDQDFHMFQEYLSMYQVLYVYKYMCVRNIYISTIVPYEIDAIYPCFLSIWSHCISASLR